MPPPLRHFDEGRPLRSYEDLILVICPRCGAPGEVRSDPSRSARFSCVSCALSLDDPSKDWRGPVVLSGRRPCGYCGHRWLAPHRNLRSRPHRHSISLRETCPACGVITEVECRLASIRSGRGLHDRNFGLKLFLQTETRFGPIWAFNSDHLDEYKNFIQASLRERRSTHPQLSAMRRLPGWIRSAKNRTLVLKAIGALERKLATYRAGRVH